MDRVGPPIDGDSENRDVPPPRTHALHVWRVRILGGFYAPPGAPSSWREVELAADQTLAELGERIPAAFEFDDDHLWSFFLSGKPWDRAMASQGQAPPQFPDVDDEDDWDESSFPGGLAEALADLLSLLYPPEGPVTVGELAGHYWEEHVEALLDGQAASRLELWRLATAVETSQLLSLLQGLGMVEHGGGSVAEPAGTAVDPELGSPTDAFLSSLAGLSVQLTPLGVWWANVRLREAGAVAPVIGELAGADAATLIEGVSGYDEWAYRAELRAWCRERGPRAARELAGYVGAAPGFEQRLLAFAGLREAGPAAEEEVRTMLADPALRPYAQLWLVGEGSADAASLEPASARVLMAETLASVLRDAGPAGLVEFPGAAHDLGSARSGGRLAGAALRDRGAPDEPACIRAP